MYARGRWYNPITGRWLGRDPNGQALALIETLAMNGQTTIAFGGSSPGGQYTDGMNLYGFARMNPLLYRDPSGRIVPIVAGLLVGAFAGAIGGGLGTIVSAWWNDDPWTWGQVGMNALKGGGIGGIGGAAGVAAAAAVGAWTGTAGLLGLMVGGAVDGGIGGGLGALAEGMSYTEAMVATAAGALLGASTAGLLDGFRWWGVRKTRGTGKATSGGIVHSPRTGGGPLPATHAKAFSGGRYTETMVTEPLVLYRRHGGKAGKSSHWWSRKPPSNSFLSKSDLAPTRGNTWDNAATIEVPPSTTIYEGTAAPNFGHLGGGDQVYIKKVKPEWFID